MTPPGISPYKISKDLEEKAKEAKLKKEQFDSILPLYKKKNEILNSNGIDEFKIAFKKIDELYSEKKYVDAYDELIKIKDDIDKRIDQLRKNLLDENKKFMEKVITLGFDLSFQKNELENAPEDMEKFSTFSKDFNIKLRKEIKNLLNNKISMLNAEAKLKILRTYGKQIDTIETLPSDNLIVLLESIKKEITEYYMQKINIEMERMDKHRVLFEKMKLAVTNFKNIEEKALNTIRSENYDDSIKMLKEFNDKTEISVKRILSEIINNLGKSIEEARYLGIDQKNFLNDLKKLEELSENGNYSTAIDMMKALSLTLEDSKIKVLGEKLEQVRNSIIDLKNQGIEVTEFLKSFETAKNLISSKKFTDAMNTLDLLLRQSKSILTQKEELLKAIDEFNINIKEFSQLGISINRDYLEKIRKMAKEDPVKAKAEFEKYYSNISKRIERSRMDYRNQMKQIVMLLKDMDVNVKNLSEILEREMEGYAFLIRINEFKEELSSMLQTDLGLYKKFENAEYFSREVKPIMDSINDDILKFDFSSALSNLKRLRESTMNLRDVFISEKIKNTKKVINDLDGIGLDLKEILNDLDAIEHEKQESAEGKLEIISLIEKAISDKITSFIAPREVFASSVQKNIEIRNLKISTEIISRRQYDLKNHLNSNDYANAIKISMDLENASKSMMNISMNYIAGNSFIDKKLSRFIPNISKYIDELKELPIEEYETRFKELLGRMDQIYSLNSLLFLRSLIRETTEIIEQTNLFQDSKNLLEMKSVDIIALEPLYIGLEKLRNDFREKVYEKILDIYLIITKLPVKEPAEKLNSAMNDYLNGKYLDAWKNLNRIEIHVNSISKDFEEISKIMNDIEGRINFFINMGIKLEKSTMILNELRSYILKGDFQGFRDSYRSLYLNIKDEIYSQVDNLLNQIDKSINDKKGKINTLISEGLISSARRILKLDNAIEAVKQGLEALENIQDYQFLKNISNNLLNRMKSSIEKFGAQAPKEFRSGFEHVQLLLHQGKYTTAIVEMNNLLSKFEDLLEKILLIKKKIEELREKISMGVQFGVKTQNVVDLFQKARVSFQSMDLEKSLQLLDEAIKEISIGIERVLGIYLNSIEYLEKIANDVEFKIKNETDVIKKLARNTIEFSFSSESKKSENLTNIANDLKARLDKFEKEVMPRLVNALESKLNQLENALSAIGRENKNDVEFIRKIWLKKLYPMVMDALPMIDYKITKFYVIHMLDYSRDAFTEITDRILFSGNVENYAINSFKISENAGDMEFNEYIQTLDKFKTELENTIAENFIQKIAKVKKDFEFINPIELSNFNDYLIKKDYRSLETNLIRIGIISAWLNIISGYISARIEAINSEMQELESFGYDLNEEKQMLNGIVGKGYLESISIIARLKELLSKKEETIPVSFNLKIIAKIGKEDIPGKISLVNRGKIPFKNVNVELSGSVEKITLTLGQLIPGQLVEKDMNAKQGNGETLNIVISYPLGNIIRESKKSIVMATIIDHGFSKKKATGEEKCNLCKGKIFKDLDMIICSKCGATYHYQCAQRVKKCISCGNAFDFSEQKEVEVSIDL